MREQHTLLGHIFYFADFLEESRGVPELLKTTVCEISLLGPEWLAFQVCNLTGAYNGAARTLRWIYESVIASTAATIDGRLLFDNTHPQGPLTREQFQEWLRCYDTNPAMLTGKKRGKILEVIGLGLEEQVASNLTYRQLCKFVHISSKNFRYEGIPDLVLNLKKFDQVSKLANQTMDLTFYCLIRSISKNWPGIVPLLRGWSQSFNPRAFQSLRKSNFPMTLKIVREIT